MAGYKNKMFVKGDDMPHHIQITSIRVEHLQDISDEESLKEGIWDSWPFPNSKNKPENCYACYVNCRSTDYRDWFNTPRDAFAALIDKVSGEGTWESDPLVWVYEFKLID